MLINCKYNTIDLGNSNFYSFVCSVLEHTYSENEYVYNNWMFELVCIETMEMIAQLNLYLWVGIVDGCNNDY